ncbi:monofunctional biosynthetic peptidoglycan transglycosylase [Luteibacter sp. PPL201]|jgi:monofunctional biosynthetic peptidoglycan transglycosylase|uniref:Biosynthetic peptidoglycan transglycosylase n=2 Tax=Luteibacter sahnii TaxID=3021977 RepID=A0ABT6B9T2_9GAMM|nr:monofunctional biosynthetic peptidoglycan transglycosylase [Luteibacter sp. PPL193]MDY1546841.1 monofunctional biosynthetic peptidoglycan transglycosylase [Luteibacter sp. PPL193]
MNPTLRRMFRILALLVVGWLALSCWVVIVLRFVPPWTSAMMMERRVELLFDGENVDFRHRWVPWNEVSPHVGIAMVAGEDQKFPFHHGFDVDAIQDAIDAADEGRRLRGASTISQQVAKNLFLWNGRSFVRKGLEAWYTVLIETFWPKRRILEVYMNIVELGDGVYGVGAASDAFFHEPPSRIGAAQAARLAAVLPNPRRFHADQPSAYVQRRTAWILQQMGQLGGPGYLDRPAPVRGRTR